MGKKFHLKVHELHYVHLVDSPFSKFLHTLRGRERWEALTGPAVQKNAVLKGEEGRFWLTSWELAYRMLLPVLVLL